jgi:tRNA (guanine37-N1)-methyltransferase
MRFDVLTLFPEIIRPSLDYSITGRALDSGGLTVEAHSIRAFSENKHHTVDDTPYGGGAGMVMAPGPVVRAIESVKAQGHA